MTEEAEAKYKEMKRKIAEAETPQWGRFYGNNHECLEDHGISAGGGVSFSEHLGKPLSDKLWIDLTMRLRLRFLRIYRYGDAQWLDAIHGAIIYLDKEGFIDDIKVALMT